MTSRRDSQIDAAKRVAGIAREARGQGGRRVQARTANAKYLHDHIVSRTCRLADAMLRMSSRHIKERWNVRNTDLRLLNILDGEPPLPVSEISRRALLDQAWVSRSLRMLESSKLVERRGDPADSRLTLVTLTKRGRAILDESRPYAEWSEQMLLAGVDARALKVLLDQLEANTQALVDKLEWYACKLAKRK